MSRLLIVEPMVPASIAASRGTGAPNLLTREPKEVWADGGAGSPATLTVDLGEPRVIDTVFLGYVRPPAASATWSVSVGTAGPMELAVQPRDALRVPDAEGQAPATSHALWHGTATIARYLAITVTQPAGSPPLTVGVLVVGKAFAPEKGQEWGFGRGIVDTGSATPLIGGGFATVDGARKRNLSWTFGDLGRAEVDRMEAIALELGQTRPVLVIEDVARTPGLRGRCHYGLFQRWRPFDRRNRVQTRWEMALEEWL